MRLSEFIDKKIYDLDRRYLGRVHDIELVADGPELGPFGPALRVHALLVGRGSIGARLGLDRPEMRGPWLLKRIFGHRNLQRIPWDHIERVTDGTLLVTRPVDPDGTPES